MRDIKRGVIQGLLIALLALGMAWQATAQSVAYYSMQNTNWPPWPTNVFPDLNVTSMGGGRYAVDDTAVDYGLVSFFFMAEDDDSPPAPGDDGGTGTPSGSPAVSFGTNLWIELLQVTNAQAFLRLHNTVSNELYQLQSKTNLIPGEMFWVPGQIVMASNTTLDFSPVDATPPNQFFRGQHGTNLVFIFAEGNAVRPDQGPGSGTDGFFQILVDHGSNPFPGVDIFYRMGGSAINGTDYVALPGVTNAPASSSDGVAFVNVVPFASTNFQFEQNVVLTLIPTNNYLIETNGSPRTILLDDNFTNSPFQLVTTNILDPAGMAYHPLSNWLIVSFDSDPGDPPNNFIRIDTNGSSTIWTGIGNLVDEIKLAIVQTNAGGFSNGDMYFGTGTNGVIGKLSANGTVSNLDWLTLPGETNTLRGSLYIDQTGVFSNDLIVVTGDQFGAISGGDVWRITSGASASLLTNIQSLHLEGVTTLPNDTNKYGPWAGKILTGALTKTNLFTVDTNGNITTFSLGIASEDIHIIPPNEDFYVADRENSLIFKLPRNLFTNFVGDVLITQEGEFGARPAVFVVYWDTNSASFLQRRILAPTEISGNPVECDLEHGTFAPMNIPATIISNE